MKIDSPLYPLSFEPYLRPMPWGGRRLADWVAGSFPDEIPIGESWLLSDHALHASRVKEGPLAGATLRELMGTRAEELLGRTAGCFPLLIKLLDARENLSVQVHPDEVAAARWAPQEGEKTEAWLVLQAGPSAAIYLGLASGVDRDALSRAIDENTVPRCLQRYSPQPGECYFVPAGTIHALGGGVVVLEVQQTSDATFRLYDWGRVDAAGKPRPLHREAGLACLKERPAGTGLMRPELIECDIERLVACEFFEMRRAAIGRPLPLRGPCLWIGLEGQAAIRSRTGAVAVERGDLVLVPACMSECSLDPVGYCKGVLVALPRK